MFETTGLAVLPGGKDTRTLASVPTARWIQLPSPGLPYQEFDATIGPTQATVEKVDFLHRLGEKNPRHLTRIAAGEIVVGNMAVKSITGVGTTVSGYHDYGFFGPQHLAAKVSGAGLPVDEYLRLVQQSVADFSNLDAARTAAFANINAPEIELGVMIAESRETLQTIIDKYDKLVRLLITAGRKASKPKKGTDFAQRLSNEWLRMRFGVEPLMRDMQDLIDLAIPKFSARVRAFGVTDDVGSYVSVRDASLGSGYPMRVQYTAKYAVNTALKSTVYVDYEADNPLYRLAKALGLHDLPSIIWQATRLSFVFDWLINIGQWIRSWSFTGGGNVVGELAASRRSVIMTVDMQLTPTFAPMGSPPTAYGPVGAFETRWFDRMRVMDTRPLLPTFHLTGNITNILDSLALLSQFFHGKR